MSETRKDEALVVAAKAPYEDELRLSFYSRPVPFIKEICFSGPPVTLEYGDTTYPATIGSDDLALSAM